MHSNSNHEMIHFTNWREQWQRQKEKEFQTMLQEVEQWARRLISIREKMRGSLLVSAMYRLPTHQRINSGHSPRTNISAVVFV